MRYLPRTAHAVFSDMHNDLWLERWFPLLTSRTGDPAILELGCGSGRDTKWLAQQGFSRNAVTDLSREALAACTRAVPGAHAICHDLREPLPLDDAHVDVVLASLCLHYFEWETTVGIVRDIRRCLAPGGLLLCRVNSTRDVHYGAIGHPEIGHHFYDVDGGMKRFFDRKDVDALFAEGWERVATKEMTIDRYEMPKVVWEAVLRKA